MSVKTVSLNSKFGHIIQTLYLYFGDHIQSSKILTKYIFGITPYPKNRITHWDICTLVSKKALNKYVADNHKVLEVGPGDLGILSLYIAKRKKIDITCVDIDPECVENAKLNAKNNSVKANIFQSDLFTNVDGLFDIIFFNPPYIPEDWGKEHGMDKHRPNFWSGGKSGTEVVERFLKDVSGFISSNGKILLGISNFYIEDSTMKEMFNKNNLILVSSVTSPLNPSTVYVLSRKA